MNEFILRVLQNARSGLHWKATFSALLLALTGACNREQPPAFATQSSAASQFEPLSTNSPAAEVRSVAFWNTVLKTYPDLPDRVQQIIDRQNVGPDSSIIDARSEITIFSHSGPVSLESAGVHVIITDCDLLTLERLKLDWMAIPERARQLGIVSQAQPKKSPAVIVLGQDGRIDIRGPTGGDFQKVDIYHAQAAGTATIKVHTFGPEGGKVFNTLHDHYGNANQVRGPPSFGSPKVPDDVLTVFVVGKLRELNVGGPAQYSRQQLSQASHSGDEKRLA